MYNNPIGLKNTILIRGSARGNEKEDFWKNRVGTFNFGLWLYEVAAFGS